MLFRSQVRQRTALVNQIRGLLSEYDIVISRRVESLRNALPDILEDAENKLTADFRILLKGLQEDLMHLDDRIDTQDQAIKRLAQEHEGAKRLQQLRGIGPITATALIAAIGDGHQFARGRDAAAWCGLVPGQHSSGGKSKLLGISKRGDTYLRTLLIHGARSVLTHAKEPGPWLEQLKGRRPANVVIVAQAAKMARTIWAMLTKQEDYQTPATATAV